jgi:hypothetical protein
MRTELLMSLSSKGLTALRQTGQMGAAGLARIHNNVSDGVLIFTTVLPICIA